MSNADFCLLVANMYIVSIMNSPIARFISAFVWLALFGLSVYKGV